MENTFDPAACNRAITSSEFYDFIVEYNNITDIQTRYNPTCFQILNEQFAVVHGRITDIQQISLSLSPLLLSPMLISEKINNSTSLKAQDLSAIEETGHGTFLAGVDAGRMVNEANFSGAAPNANLVIVKLKPAKQYLRDLFAIHNNAILYQSNDLMLGIRYCIEKAASLGLPLILCISLGTNQGGHDGRSILEEYINIISSFSGISVVIAAGNETTLSRHATVQFTNEITTANVNLRVGRNETGFSLRIWGKVPDVFSVGIVTPSGESVQQIPARLGQRDTISFILEPTRILIEYNIIEIRTGDPLVVLRFTNPSEGIWSINLARIAGVNQLIHLWLPCCNWVSENTYFIEVNADTTITVPGTAYLALTVGGYNHRTDGIFINSSRGNNRYNTQSPVFVAPAVNITGPIPNNQYTTRSGTSIAAAIATGAAALLYQWGLNSPETRMNSLKIKNLIIKGAIRKPNIFYPNRESSYGILNLLNTFNMLRSFQ